MLVEGPGVATAWGGAASCACYCEPSASKRLFLPPAHQSPCSIGRSTLEPVQGAASALTATTASASAGTHDGQRVRRHDGQRWSACWSALPVRRPGRARWPRCCWTGTGGATSAGRDVGLRRGRNSSTRTARVPRCLPWPCVGPSRLCVLGLGLGHLRAATLESGTSSRMAAGLWVEEWRARLRHCRAPPRASWTLARIASTPSVERQARRICITAKA